MLRIFLGLACAVIYLSAVIGFGVGQPRTSLQSSEATNFHDCLVEISAGKYAGIRFFQLAGAPGTLSGPEWPTASSASSESRCSAVPAQTTASIERPG